jgi:putative phage-type endonuclease
MIHELLVYLDTNPSLYVEPNFLKKLLEWATKAGFNTSNEKLEAELQAYHANRSEPSYLAHALEPVSKLDYLLSIPQPVQRTPEWYQFRNEHLTASNAWKVFGTNATRNQLIFEKCSPVVERKNGLQETPMSWGQKYEPITIELYQDYNKTIVSEFGCIPHPTYSFLAASPDGIVTGPVNYGRMIEVKNVVSREITGIPKKDYYIQMQLQMEVCDLAECDFVETKFVEYDTEHEYFSDETSEKGVIVVFVENEGFVYDYMPLRTAKEAIEPWLNEHMEGTTERVWFKNVYWKLQTYSCVLVRRQTKWFQSVIGDMQQLWHTILDERISGQYVLRAAKKRPTKDIEDKKMEVEIF